MTDDRSLERAARSWIDEGPTRAPERAVEHALQRIQTTSQERDLWIPQRFQTMSLSARLAAAAVIGVLAVGAIYSLWRPGGNVAVPGPTATPTASPDAVHSAPPSPSAPTYQSYKAARDALCAPALAQVIALNDQAGKLKPDKSASDLHAMVANLTQVVAVGTTLTDNLAKLDPPSYMAADHQADVVHHRDSLAILQQSIAKFQAGKVAEANAVSDATTPLSTLEEAFEQNYGLSPCP
jgi:hypothetical protein